MDLLDLADGVIPGHIFESIVNNVAVEFRQAAASRRAAVARGAETPQFSATLLDRYGTALAKALALTGIRSDLQQEVDAAVREIDSDFEANRRARWAAKPASLSITV
ncbi:hypothetical protein QRD43_21215 [Pelomonas sp. APW6]|uniref:Uncharacterized protein n=1 Tax=Roseateles subflavus TaxID=3053353 RepID=A0ABT7LQF2_9BURK|nr:hypothetical protein [Pelomonas sp. APW6]MDL5034437.1 hypothetical protein [Pelomonas sp. APW6]